MMARVIDFTKGKGLLIALGLRGTLVVSVVILCAVLHRVNIASACLCGLAAGVLYSPFWLPDAMRWRKYTFAVDLSAVRLYVGGCLVLDQAWSDLAKVTGLPSNAWTLLTYKTSWNYGIPPRRRVTLHFRDGTHLCFPTPLHLAFLLSHVELPDENLLVQCLRSDLEWSRSHKDWRNTSVLRWHVYMQSILVCLAAIVTYYESEFWTALTPKAVSKGVICYLVSAPIGIFIMNSLYFRRLFKRMGDKGASNERK